LIIGIDMGGTNIDGVAIDEGRLIKHVKRPVDRSDYFLSIWGAIKELLQDVNKEKISRIQLSTTISTNAIVEKRISKVGVILQRGPGLSWEFDDLGDHVEDVSGSVDHRGIPIASAGTDELVRIRDDFSHHSVESVALISKFSTRNSTFEKQAADFLKDSFQNITMGHTLSGKLSFPRRVQTSYLNAAVSSTFQNFAINIRNALKREGIDAPIYILKADGGTIDLDGAIAKPVETILSGPAASFMGMSALLAQDHIDRCLLDIGGTTTDLFFLVDGVPVFEPSGIEIDGRKTLVRAIYSTSIGLGGDSYVRIEGGELKIGPKRMDHAIVFGGKYLTPTDALVYLGDMKVEHSQKSAEAIEEAAQALQMSAESFAKKIIAQFCKTIKFAVDSALQKIHENPVYTIKELLSDRTLKPESFGVIGGPAEALRGHLQREFNLPVELPPAFEIANAIGAALARPTVEITLLADTDRKILSIPELGVYEEIDKSYRLERAKDRALQEVHKASEAMGFASDIAEAEITEASSFNMIKGYYGADRNIRVKAQIKPGLITQAPLTQLKSRNEENDESK